MSGRDYLGEFEHIIVLALLRLDDRAYGVSVRQEIEFRTNREVSIGAVYATLDRLETKGFVKSHRGDPTPERGGRSKRFFRVTAKGVAAVNRTQRALQRLTEGLDLIRTYSRPPKQISFSRLVLPSGSSIYLPLPKKQNRSEGTCLRNTSTVCRNRELPSPETGIGDRR